MKKIKYMLVVYASIAMCFTSVAQNNKTGASVDFKIKNFGLNVTGFFGDVSITHDFSSQNPSEWLLSGIVKVNSIDTGIEKRDKHLLEDDYFDVSIYPEIKLLATNFKKASGNSYTVTAKLTIKKSTKTITIPIEIKQQDTNRLLQANFEINRRDYDVGGSSFSMSNTAKISVNYTFKKP